MKTKQTLFFKENEIKTIKFNLSYRKKIQQPLNKFIYTQSKTYQQNINRLCQIIETALNLTQDLGNKFIQAFKEYINCQYNIPIQVNLKNLKYEQLLSLFQEWQISLNKNQSLEISQRLYTINHRNILFNRVFVEEKANITQYFETLSDKKMLKPVDIYQLLVDILSHYYLYQYSSDNQTFFEKVNSFNNFLQMVEVFKHSERRIVIDNKSKNFDYIKIYQFQALINFWQSINTQLQLRSDKRFSICSVEVQTQKNMVMLHRDCQTQTQDKTIQKITLQQTINKSLKDLNKLTEEQNQPQKLQIIQNICEALRKQKIKLFQLAKNINSVQFKKNYQNSPISIGDLRLQQNDLIVQDGQKSQSQKTQKISMRNSRRFQQNKEKAFIKRKADQKMTQNIQNSIIINKIQNFQNYQQIKQKSRQKSQQRLNNYRNNNQNPYFKRSQQKNDRKIYLQKGNLVEIQDNQNQIFPQRQSTNFLLKLLQKIYSFYCESQSGAMNIDKLNQFFTDIGIINQGQTSLSFKLIRRNRIQNVNKIKIFEFLQIMEQIKKQDKDLTFQVIQEFVNYQMEQKKIINQQKNFQQSFHHNKYSKSTLNKELINKNREKSTEKQSRRYKYSQQNQDVDLTNMFKAKQRGSVPLLGVNNRLGIDRRNNDF